MTGRYDAVVVGAGSFGAWCAFHLQRAGKRTLLVDPYGPGNSRSSSGGETRLIRMGYGADEVYTRLALRSLALWREVFGEAAADLFQPTGVLWLAPVGNAMARETERTLSRLVVRHEILDAPALAGRYPQLRIREDEQGLFEPDAGVLMARRAVARVVREARRMGLEMAGDAALPVTGGADRLGSLRTASGAVLEADFFVFAGGSWMPRLLPDVLGERIFPTRQEVFFFGPPAGERRFGPDRLPAWIDFGTTQAYGVPDLDGRGVKVAIDAHGPAFDPDRDSRLASPEGARAARAVLADRFPDLLGAPLLESRVCPYENTSNGDFLVDRHPTLRDVWMIGGGSGHGFKHGPAVGEHAVRLILEGLVPEPRFSLAAKRTSQARSVY